MNANNSQSEHRQAVIMMTRARMWLFIKGGHRMDFTGQPIEAVVAQARQMGLHLVRIQAHQPGYGY